MVKADIVRAIELKLGLSHTDASHQTEGLLHPAKSTVTKAQAVWIRGLRTWKGR